MSIHEASPLENFHHFVGEQLRLGRSADITPEEAVRGAGEELATLDDVELPP